MFLGGALGKADLIIALNIAVDDVNPLIRNFTRPARLASLAERLNRIVVLSLVVQAARLSDEGELNLRLGNAHLNLGQYGECVAAIQDGVSPDLHPTLQGVGRLRDLACEERHVLAWRDRACPQELDRRALRHGICDLVTLCDLTCVLDGRRGAGVYPDSETLEDLWNSASDWATGRSRTLPSRRSV